jgi:malate synthase
MDDRASDIQVVGRVDERGEEILTPDALAFVEELQRRFGGRDELLRRRRVRREEMPRAATADFLPETRKVRTSAWTVAPAPADLVDRRDRRTPRTENGDQRAEFRVARLVGRPERCEHPSLDERHIQPGRTCRCGAPAPDL